MMYLGAEDFSKEYRPRLIIWQLTRNENLPDKSSFILSKHECFLIIDSIASLSKPIVVFSGADITCRPDLYDIVIYGNQRGLKTIIEIKPDKLTNEIVEKFHHLGSRIFRLMINDCITENIDTRFEQSPAFIKLEDTIQRLKSKGFEIHLSIKITHPDLRKLACCLDYAFRCNAQGLYCHLSFDKSIPEVVIGDGSSQSLDEFIGKISDLKSLVPNEMYVSPQCVKYIPFSRDDSDFDLSSVEYPRWVHCCLAGKTYAYIAENGKVYVCSARCKECGDLRESQYDFKSLWFGGNLLNLLRESPRTCVQTRLLFKKKEIVFNNQEEVSNAILEVER
jgi:MoaA/NifB/PqqE/SkfB family radical SAM enzyme